MPAREPAAVSSASAVAMNAGIPVGDSLRHAVDLGSARAPDPDARHTGLLESPYLGARGRVKAASHDQPGAAGGKRRGRAGLSERDGRGPRQPRRARQHQVGNSERCRRERLEVGVALGVGGDDLAASALERAADLGRAAAHRRQREARDGAAESRGARWRPRRTSAPGRPDRGRWRSGEPARRAPEARRPTPCGPGRERRGRPARPRARKPTRGRPARRRSGLEASSRSS